MDDSNSTGQASAFLSSIYKFIAYILSRFFNLSVVLVFLSNVVWFAVALYCLRQYNNQHRNDLMRFAYVTFLLSALNGAMGITEFFYENVMSSMTALLELLQSSLAVPCLTTEIWLKYDVAQKEVAWLHTIIGLIPTYIYLFQHYTRQDLIDFTVVMNIVSLFGIGIVQRNLYAMASSVLVFLAYCVFSLRSDFSAEPTVSKQCYNYCMALFTFCGYKVVINPVAA